MKRCNLDCQFISEFDLFGKDPEFYFKGKPQRTSKFGKFLSYFYIAIYVSFFLYKIIRMLKKVDITFYESYAYSGLPSIQLNNNLFYGGFSLSGIIEPSIYYPMVFYWEGHRENGQMIWEDPPKVLDLERCKIEKFGKRYQEIFKDKDLNNMYCLKDIEKVTLEGYSYLDSHKYLQVVFYPCVDYGIDVDGNIVTCQDISIVQAFFQKNFLSFNIEDIELTPHLYDTPSQPLEKDITGPAFQALYQQFYAYLQIVILETEKDTIGFEALSDIETQKFLKYEESWIVAAPSPSASGLVQQQPIVDVSILLSPKVLTQKRKNTKLIEVLGDVGGLMEVVWSFFSIIATVITDLLYEKALINNLFSFDLDKKIINLKKKNNLKEVDTAKFNDTPTIYSTKFKNNKTPSGFENQEETLKKTEFKKQFTTESPTSPKRKKKKKKVLKSKLTVVSSLSKNNELTSKNLKEENLKNLDEINIYKNNNRSNVNKFNFDYGVKSEVKLVNKETERNIDDRRIIDRIRINCGCIYFCFCFVRKRKNIQNVVFDEGMGIIIENLDILNVFKKIYYMNQLEENLKLNEIFDMSDKCKTKIDYLDKALLKKRSKG